jgi:hypothetical protein
LKHEGSQSDILHRHLTERKLALEIIELLIK